jgi:hypothetical protein
MTDKNKKHYFISLLIVITIGILTPSIHKVISYMYYSKKMNSISVGDIYTITYDKGNPFDEKTETVTIVDKEKGDDGNIYVQYMYDGGYISSCEIRKFAELYDKYE